MSAAGPGASARARVGDWLELTKPRLSLLVVATTLVGYLVAVPATGSPTGLLLTLLGTTLVVGGANALNQVYEREVDALMHRTRHRPLPSGRLWARPAGAFGLLLAAVGLTVLALWVNATAALLGAAGFVLYVFVYTPLKRITYHCTLVGAIPGAIPPLIGWAAAAGRLDGAAWALFATLFFWQMPHFLAIARLFREDYRRAGMVMHGIEEDGTPAYRRMIVYALLLLPASLAMWAQGAVGDLYAAGAVLLGIGFVVVAWRNLRRPDRAADRTSFFYSLLYLTALLTLMMIDRQPAPPGRLAASMRELPVWLAVLPTVNAMLNATSAAFLLTGYRFIRQRRIEAHRACMLAAFTAATLFLVGYLTLHWQVGATPFGHEGTWVRSAYMLILTSHTVLAIVAAPMVLLTLARALRGRFQAHARLARRTLPIWLYVSITGVLVYVMLYHVPGAAG